MFCDRRANGVCWHLQAFIERYLLKHSDGKSVNVQRPGKNKSADQGKLLFQHAPTTQTEKIVLKGKEEALIGSLAVEYSYI